MTRDDHLSYLRRVREAFALKGEWRLFGEVDAMIRAETESPSVGVDLSKKDLTRTAKSRIV